MKPLGIAKGLFVCGVSMASESIGTARVDIVVNTDDLQTGIEAAKRQMRGFEGASDSVKQELERMTAAQRRNAEQMLRQINTLQLGKEGMAAFRIETRTTGEVQKFLREQLAATSAAAQKTGNQFAMSQKQMDAALRGVPAQFTDIVVSLQGGQNPLTVFLQQGGQLKDMFNGAGNAAKALGGYVLSLVNPFTVAAAAVVGLGFAMAKAEATLRTEMSWQAYADATGRGVELSTQAMKKLRAEMALLPGVSKAMASSVIGDLAGMRDLSTASIQGIALAAADVAVIMRSDVPSAAKALGKALSDPEKGVTELNSVLRVFSAEQIASVQAMVEMGDKAGAQAAMLEVLHKATSGLAQQGLTPLQKATNDFGNSWDTAMVAMSNGGPLQTANELMAGLVSRTAEAVDWLRQLRLPPWLEAQFKGGLNGALYNAITGGVKASANTGGATGSWGENTGGATGSWGAPEVSEEAKAWNLQIEALRKSTDGYKATSAVMTELKGHSKELSDALQTLKNRGEGGSDLAKRLQANLDGVNERLAEMKKRGSAGAARIASADLSADIADIQSRYRQLTGSQSNAERIFEAQRQAGLVKEGEYFSKKREFLQENARLQVRELEEENQRYAKQAATGADRINNDKKIAQNIGKMAEIRARASADLQVLAIQEGAANRQLEASYVALTQSMEEYVNSAQNRYQRELEGLGQGNEWRNRNAAANQIDDRYRKLRDDLRNNRELLEMSGKWNTDLEAQYRRRLEIIGEANRQELALDADYWQQRTAMQANWSVGMSEAFRNYQDQAANVAQQTADLFGNVYKGLEDGAVNFAMKGKLSFKDMANSFIADVIRMQVRAAMSGLFGNLMGAFGIGGSGKSAWLAPGLQASGAVTSGVSGWGSVIGTALSGISLNALGGVYDSPSLSRYQNQVIDKPTFFAFAKGGVPSLGVGGEAGPEAVMPLTRAPDGNLGVRALGAPAKPSVQIVLQPTINIDGRTDRAEVEALVVRGMNIAIQQAQAELLDKMSRGMA